MPWKNKQEVTGKARRPGRERRREAAWVLLSVITMLFLCACGKQQKVWEKTGDTLVQMEVPEALEEAEAQPEETGTPETSRETGEQTGMPESSEETGEPGGLPGDTSAFVCVYVCGAVAVPDVYTLTEGSRMYEAVALAGGMTEDADAEQVNLAVPLTDGQKVRIPRKGEVPGGEQLPDVPVEASGKKAGTVNINTAGREELMTLTGIGSTRAEAILAYRKAHGAFQSPAELLKVNGIKEKTYEKIKSQISIE